MDAERAQGEETSEDRQDRAGEGFVDWQTAARLGRRLVNPGPKVTRSELHDLVAELRQASIDAVAPVARTTGMSVAGANGTEADAPALIVDRAGWIEANVASLQGMLDPVLEQVADRHLSPAARAAGTPRWGGAVAAAEVAALISWVSTKVLGQYDLAPQGTPRLLLVAPNVLSVERELEVDAADFRLWVCLHEETHRLQFTAVPWLRTHIIDSARSLGTALVPDRSDLADRLQQIASAIPGVLRGEIDVTQVLASPEQREQLARITAVMSLLEGHADVVMDEVGPQVVPSVATIRRRFEARRSGSGSIDRLLRRLLGMEAKMRQYRDGAAFVRGVVDQVGMEGLNRVWESPDTLPLPAEISEPRDWVTRVHG